LKTAMGVMAQENCLFSQFLDLGQSGGDFQAEKARQGVWTG